MYGVHELHFIVAVLLFETSWDRCGAAVRLGHNARPWVLLFQGLVWDFWSLAWPLAPFATFVEERIFRKSGKIEFRGRGRRLIIIVAHAIGSLIRPVERFVNPKSTICRSGPDRSTTRIGTNHDSTAVRTNRLTFDLDE